MPEPEASMYGQVMRFARRTDGLACDYVTVRWFFHGVQFDVVAYDNTNNEFHIVECKRGSKPTDVGHAFGQLLEYKAIIHENGYDFLNDFNERVRGRIELGNLRESHIPVKFYVGLTSEACRNIRLLEYMKRDGLEYVGIIRINNQGLCRKYIKVDGYQNSSICEAQTRDVPTIRTFQNGKSFVEMVFRNTRKKLPTSFRNFKLGNFHEQRNEKHGFRKLWYDITTKANHFEVHLTKNGIEVGLHIEGLPKDNSSLFNYLAKDRRAILDTLGDECKFEHWGKSWKRIYELRSVKDLTETELEITVAKLVDYVKTLQPRVERWKKTR